MVLVGPPGVVGTRRGRYHGIGGVPRGGAQRCGVSCRPTGSSQHACRAQGATNVWMATTPLEAAVMRFGSNLVAAMELFGSHQ
jgi:hypothetical protein